jgi:hypothetical protein
MRFPHVELLANIVVANKERIILRRTVDHPPNKFFILLGLFNLFALLRQRKRWNRKIINFKRDNQAQKLASAVPQFSLLPQG